MSRNAASSRGTKRAEAQWARLPVPLCRRRQEKSGCDWEKGEQTHIARSRGQEEARALVLSPSAGHERQVLGGAVACLEADGFVGGGATFRLQTSRRPLASIIVGFRRRPSPPSARHIACVAAGVAYLTAACAADGRGKEGPQAQGSALVAQTRAGAWRKKRPSQKCSPRFQRSNCRCTACCAERARDLDLAGRAPRARSHKACQRQQQ
mmetsp:Transcript_15628/g.51018  ORF Transcript_15628/g.51018 Transcript_15628/m.51018 type:complete len:209 (+) Transcript_15628:559-1185(+)